MKTATLISCLSILAFSAELAFTADLEGTETPSQDLLPGQKAFTQTSVNTILDGINVNKQILNMAKSDSVELQYELLVPAKVSAYVWDSFGRRVRVLLDGHELPKGSHAVSWDGKDGHGNPVPNEAYTFALHARDSVARAESYDPAATFEGEIIRPMNLTVPSPGFLQYFLEKPCRVQIQMGVSRGPLLDVILRWEPRTKGVITERCDGKDPSGQVDLVKAFPKAKIQVKALTLPNDCVIVVKGKQLDPASLMSDSAYPTRRVPNSDIHSKGGFSADDFLKAWPPELALKLSQSPAKNEAGHATLTGTVPVEISLGRADQERLAGRAYDYACFIDGQIVEIPGQSDGLHLDTSAWSDGEHVLTVNIHSGGKPFGTYSQYIDIQNHAASSGTEASVADSAQPEQPANQGRSLPYHPPAGYDAVSTWYPDSPFISKREQYLQMLASEPNGVEGLADKWEFANNLSSRYFPGWTDFKEFKTYDQVHKAMKLYEHIVESYPGNELRVLSAKLCLADRTRSFGKSHEASLKSLHQCIEILKVPMSEITDSTRPRMSDPLPDGPDENGAKTYIEQEFNRMKASVRESAIAACGLIKNNYAESYRRIGEAIDLCEDVDPELAGMAFELKVKLDERRTARGGGELPFDEKGRLIKTNQ